MLSSPSIRQSESSHGNTDVVGGERGKAPIIKAAFWFDRKLFSSRWFLRSREPPSTIALFHSRSLAKRGIHYSRALANVSVDR